ncbi:hypothetical protein UREG_05868 [Uncinocarpus reesii 1704]|uniref:Uncharacterized protein n=1 Tax=Uncinocarpus reesii (strain UAMH 1704) TaxID=336963 RepID=C4JTS9_UNCRE|nr:uncharacterized protein UREG_05868 [Uncinocarpus reesii 1704]EEP81026.1 hypothetical protein UREG_05868 [Uncinocarpus reesii 1704]
MARSGFDWICVDTEHGNIADAEMHEAVGAIASLGVSPIVRVAANEGWMVKRALDSGAHGVLVPLLETVEDARKLVEAAKFPPMGKRGFGSPFALGSFGNMSSTEYLLQANDALLTIVQIETKEALKNVEEIAKVPGIDVLLVGPYDLGNNIGRPVIDGFHPELEAAIERIRKAAVENGKRAGIYSSNGEMAKKFAEQGFHMALHIDMLVSIPCSSTRPPRSSRTVVGFGPGPVGLLKYKNASKEFEDLDEPCHYHPGPPKFHEGQKGWECCKPRVLTFEEFLEIPPCTVGKHSAVDDTPAAEAPKAGVEDELAPVRKTVPISQTRPSHPPSTLGATGVQTPPSGSPAPPESESDDPSLEIPANTECRRRGCKATYNPGASRDAEECVHHPGQPIFHEGSKGWSCCKRRVLEFDEFMKIPGCATKARHLFIGKGKKEEKVDTVRTDFYQTPSTVMVSFYLKKIDKDTAKVDFSSPTTIKFDLPTTDNKRFLDTYELFAPIDTQKSTYKIMGTKMELTLVKADGSSWPVLRSNDQRTGEIIQTGRATKA